jgi:NADH-quinone oxidoreductase subunit A
MEGQLPQYSSLLVHIVSSVGFAMTTWVGSLLLGRIGRRTGVKDLAYECGMLPEPGAQPRFSVKFYLVAMLFILFDIEIVFLYPWSIIYREYLLQYGTGILTVLATFTVILFTGYLYAVKKGALDWSK